MRSIHLRTATDLSPLRSLQKRILFFSVFFTKTTSNVITDAATGENQYLRGMQPGPVVDRGEEPERTHSAGPNSSHYEAFRNIASAHLVYTAFWSVKHFCVHQMIMSEPMHQIDMGAIVHLIRAILRKYLGCTETTGRAAARLKERFDLLFSKRAGPDG